MFMPGEIDMSRKYEEHWDGDRLICVNTKGMSIPPDPDNMDYARYLEWKRLGGVPTVVDVTPAAPGKPPLMEAANEGNVVQKLNELIEACRAKGIVE